MANITFSGTEELMQAFGRISQIPFEVTEEALDAMADVAVREIKETGDYYGVRDETSDVHILDKIVTKKAKKTEDGGNKAITFDGTRRRGKNGTSTRNAEIAFVNEYGKRGQDARPFIRQAIEKNGELIAEPAAKIIGDWIENEFNH